MSTALIVIGLLAIAGIVVFMATRKKDVATPKSLPQDGDTGWNDPLTPGQPARTDLPPKDTPQA